LLASLWTQDSRFTVSKRRYGMDSMCIQKWTSHHDPSFCLHTLSILPPSGTIAQPHKRTVMARALLTNTRVPATPIITLPWKLHSFALIPPLAVCPLQLFPPLRPRYPLAGTHTTAVVTCLLPLLPVQHLLTSPTTLDVHPLSSRSLAVAQTSSTLQWLTQLAGPSIPSRATRSAQRCSRAETTKMSPPSSGIVPAHAWFIVDRR
jgi:hypothetical protein